MANSSELFGPSDKTVSLGNIAVQSSPAEPLQSRHVSGGPPSSGWLRGSPAPADFFAVLPAFIHPGSDWTPVDVGWFGLFIHPFPDSCFPVLCCQICIGCSSWCHFSRNADTLNWVDWISSGESSLHWCPSTSDQVLLLRMKGGNTVFYQSSAHFCAIAAPAERRKPPHYQVCPRWCLPPVSCFGHCGASAPEHFALMKSCHSSGCDGWEGNQFLEAFWYSFASAGRGETSLAKQKAEMWLMPLNLDLWPHRNLDKMLIVPLEGGATWTIS